MGTADIAGMQPFAGACSFTTLGSLVLTQNFGMIVFTRKQYTKLAMHRDDGWPEFAVFF